MKNNDFEYKYSAPTSEERKEIESIRNNYQPKTKELTKLNKLRQLDNRVKNIPTIISLAFGIMGALVFGLGLAMIMEWDLLVWGIVVGLVGVTFMLLTYSIYNFITKKLKEKYGKEILSLSEELLNDNN